MTIMGERTTRLEALRTATKTHCMCLRLVETPGQIRVIYPDGYFPAGCQTAIGKGGKSAAFERLLPVMERHWKESFP